MNWEQLHIETRVSEMVDENEARQYIHDKHAHELGAKLIKRIRSIGNQGCVLVRYRSETFRSEYTLDYYDSVYVSIDGYNELREEIRKLRHALGLLAEEAQDA